MHHSMPNLARRISSAYYGDRPWIQERVEGSHPFSTLRRLNSTHRITLEAENRTFTVPDDRIIVSAQSTKYAVATAPNDHEAGIMRLSRAAYESRNVSRADTYDCFALRGFLHFCKPPASRFDQIGSKLRIHIGLRTCFYRRDGMGNRESSSNTAREVPRISKSVDTGIIQIYGAKDVGQVWRRRRQIHLEVSRCPNGTWGVMKNLGCDGAKYKPAKRPAAVCRHHD
jgi:hypothetical protein